MNAPGKHRVVLATLADTLGTSPDVIAYFQQLRGMRHRGIYEGSMHVSESEVEDAVTEAAKLLEHLRMRLAARTHASDLTHNGSGP